MGDRLLGSSSQPGQEVQQALGTESVSLASLPVSFFRHYVPFTHIPFLPLLKLEGEGRQDQFLHWKRKKRDLLGASRKVDESGAAEDTGNLAPRGPSKPRDQDWCRHQTATTSLQAS